MIRRATSVVLVYALLTCLSAAIFSAFVSFGCTRHFLQILHWDDASEILSVQIPGTAEFRLDDALARAEVVLPQFDVYVLDADGRILLPQAKSGAFVDPGPLREALQSPAPTEVLFGQIPDESKVRGIFSVAEFLVGGKTRYLYMVHKDARSWTRHAIATLLPHLLLPILLAFTGFVLVSIATVWYLSRNFRAMAAGIASFSRGHYEQPLAVPAGGELTSIAARVERLAQLAERQEHELSERSAYREELLAGLVHDMRGPITAARGFVDSSVPITAGVSADFLRQCLAGTRASLSAQQTLASQLSTASAEELAVNQVQLTKFDLRQHLLQLELRHAPAALQRGVKIVLNCPADAGMVEADSMLVERALDNLLGNALKFTPREGTISITARGETEAVTITVADTGSGISQADLARIFERYYRSDESRQAKGYGLGLATVRRTAELHGGSISVTSSKGEGSTFTLRLPRTSKGLEHSPEDRTAGPSVADTDRPVFNLNARSIVLVLLAAIGIYFVCLNIKGPPLVTVSALIGIIVGYCIVASASNAAAAFAIFAFIFVLFQANVLLNELPALLFLIGMWAGFAVKFGVSKRFGLRLGTRASSLLFAAFLTTTVLSTWYTYQTWSNITRDLELPQRRDTAQRIAAYLTAALPSPADIFANPTLLQSGLRDFARLDRSIDLYLADANDAIQIFESWDRAHLDLQMNWSTLTTASSGLIYALGPGHIPQRTLTHISFARLDSGLSRLYFYVRLENELYDVVFRKLSQRYMLFYSVGLLLHGLLFAVAVARIVSSRMQRVVSGIEREVQAFEGFREVSRDMPESPTVAAVRDLIHAVRSRSEKLLDEDALTRRLVSSIALAVNQRSGSAVALLESAENAEKCSAAETVQRKLTLLHGVLKQESNFLEDILTAATPIKKGKTEVLDLAETVEDSLLEAARGSEGCAFSSAIDDPLEVSCDGERLRRLLQHLCHLTAARGATRAVFKATKSESNIRLSMHTDEQPAVVSSEHTEVFEFISVQFAQALGSGLTREADDAGVVYRCFIAQSL